MMIHFTNAYGAAQVQRFERWISAASKATSSACETCRQRTTFRTPSANDIRSVTQGSSIANATFYIKTEHSDTPP
jgi:hypothetical protein